MAKKEFMRKVFVFQPYETGAVETFLTKKASEGWMIDSIKGRAKTPFIFVFRRDEPQKLTFSVDYFRWGSIYEEEPMMPTEEYIEYCEKAGWRHACTKGKMQVFYTELEGMVPIQTDDSVKFKSISDAFVKQNIIYVLLSLPVLWLHIFWFNFNFESFITENLLIANVVALALILTTVLWVWIDFMKWRRNAKKCLKEERELPIETQKHVFTQLHFIIFDSLYGLTMLYLILPEATVYRGLLFLGMFLSAIVLLLHAIYFEKRNYSTVKRRAIVAGRAVFFLVVYIVLVFNVSNYLGVGYQWTDNELVEPYITALPAEERTSIHMQASLMQNQKSILTEQTTYVQYFRVPESVNSKVIRINVFDSSSDWIRSRLIEERLEYNRYDFTFTQGNPAAWGVDQLYVMEGDSKNWKDVILMEYMDRVLILESEVELKFSDENIKGIREILLQTTEG